MNDTTTNQEQGAKFEVGAPVNENVKVSERPHDAVYHYKSFPKDASNNGYKKLMDLIKAGKLSESELNEDKRDDGTPVVKRVSQRVTMPVPVVADMLRNDLELPATTIQHLQDLITKYIEDKQREDVDNVTGSLRHWSVILSEPFAKRSTSVKVTKEQVEAASKFLDLVLNEIGMAEKGREFIVALAGKKFGASACRGQKPEVLEKIQEKVLEAFEQVADTDEGMEHGAVFSLWLDNIEKALAPQDDNIEVDMFDTE